MFLGGNCLSNSWSPSFFKLLRGTSLSLGLKMALDRVFHHFRSRFILNSWSLYSTHMPVTSIGGFVNSDVALYRIRHQFWNVGNSFIEKVFIPLHYPKSRTILCLLFPNEGSGVSLDIKRCICELFGTAFFGTTRRGVISGDSDRENVKTWSMVWDRCSFGGSWSLKTKLSVSKRK